MDNYFETAQRMQKSSKILFDNNEIILFDEKEECLEKINYYLNNDEERKKVAKNGWGKAHNSYNSTRVTKFMIETIFEENYSEEYEWKNQIISSAK